MQELSRFWRYPVPNVEFDCKECMSDEILACYVPWRETICLKSGLVTGDTVAHEWGHYVRHQVDPRPCDVATGCEEWARAFELWWSRHSGGSCLSCSKLLPLATQEFVTCPACGSLHQVIDFQVEGPTPEEASLFDEFIAVAAPFTVSLVAGIVGATILRAFSGGRG